ncbi:MAG TPA: xanthine dehydrogenase family protein subunit M [Terriglobales bacterium]|nr:xanthine dehydrogenase family protein subunit M [Terriglobales bacterium]
MASLAYAAADNLGAAIEHSRRTPGAEFIAGGTDLLQLLEDRVRNPTELIDLNGLPLGGIEVEAGGARLGALARMAEVADHPLIQKEFPAVAEALLASASPQVRNMATIGGNLLQRTRCLYYRDAASPCNKRHPGSGCPAQEGQNRINAILGGSHQCIAAYPGDLAVALVALDATVDIAGANGLHMLPIRELHCLPGETPHIETVLGPGDVITSVLIPFSAHARRSRYLKIRDRASFQFALASAAVALDIKDGIIKEARVAVGGVATKPWRLEQLERMLVGEPVSPELFRAAALRASEGAAPREQNRFKVTLIQRVVERALQMTGGSS